MQGKSLLKDTPKVATFYLLPKILKNAQAPPGHPIVSSTQSLCEPIYKCIDYFLHPIVETLPSYLKTTHHALWKMDSIQLDDMMFVTRDVESLHTSTRHSDKLQTTLSFLYMSDLDKDLCDLILVLLDWAWTHNFFFVLGIPLSLARSHCDGGCLLTHICQFVPEALDKRDFLY